MKITKIKYVIGIKHGVCTTERESMSGATQNVCANVDVHIRYKANHNITKQIYPLNECKS